MKKLLIIVTVVVSLFVIIALGVGYYFSNILLMKDFNKTYTSSTDIDTIENKENFLFLRNELTNEKLEIQSSNGYSLIGYYFPAEEETNKTVVTVHGYQSSKDSQSDYITMYHELGYNVFAYDHQNHGESGGSFTTYGIIESEDLSEIVTYLKENEMTANDEEIVGVHGVSMGASTTLLYAGSEDADADFYISDCAYSNFGEEALYRLGIDYSYIPELFQKPIVYFGNLVYKLRTGYSIYEAAPINVVDTIEAPVLFINTKTDDYIPPYMTTDLYEKKEGNKEIYLTETGAHAEAITVDPETYEETVSDFIATYVD